VINFRTLFFRYSQRPDWSPGVTSVYLICGALISIYEAMGLARLDVHL
jgi:hypothetical protein